METSWDRLKRQLQDFYQAAADKSDELARIGARRIDVLSLRRALSREMIALGARVYELVTKEATTSIAEDSEVIRRIAAARELEQEIGRRELEIDQIRAAAADRRTAQRSDSGVRSGPVPGESSNAEI